MNVSDKKKPEPELNEDNSKAFKGMSDFKRNIRIGGAFNLGSFIMKPPAFKEIYFL